jgi:hypothetical protein
MAPTSLVAGHEGRGGRLTDRPGASIPSGSQGLPTKQDRHAKQNYEEVAQRIDDSLICPDLLSPDGVQAYFLVLPLFAPTLLIEGSPVSSPVFLPHVPILWVTMPSKWRGQLDRTSQSHSPPEARAWHGSGRSVAHQF